MNRWTALDWLFTLGPFLILGGMAWFAVRRARTAVPR